MKRLLLFFLFTLGMFFQSCQEDPEMVCSGICTEEFRTININITNQEGEPVALDNFKVVNLKTSKEITRELSGSALEYAKKNGIYPIFGDEYASEYKNKEVTLNFLGNINNEIVVDQNYKVSADCCHVFLISGSTEVVIP